jgi:hypothetical protein
MSSNYAGQCLCGDIHYAVESAPLFMGNCHCKDCQRSSGSAYTPAMLFPEKDVLISGKAHYFETQSDNGNTHQRGFCPRCGSQLFAKFSKFPGMLGVKAGTLNESARYQPMLDFHVSSAASWDFMNPELPKKQGPAQA